MNSELERVIGSIDLPHEGLSSQMLRYVLVELWLCIIMDLVDNEVSVIRNLIDSSPNIKKEVIAAGALQHIIGLLRKTDPLVLRANEKLLRFLSNLRLQIQNLELNLERLRMVVDDLLVKLTKLFQKPKLQIVFLTNNYDMMIAVLKSSDFIRLLLDEDSSSRSERPITVSEVETIVKDFGRRWKAAIELMHNDVITSATFYVAWKF
ncbi:hypothetical protein C2S51_026172 [Perilla frutescens var. frutescens]|nr:hypothetical protein C2S51_026172 [Perilla frutescens var. frutescens]